MAEKYYKLRILPLFEDDLNEIVDYISIHLQNPIAAENFVDAVETAIYERLSCAEAFEPYSSAKERRYPYYHLQPQRFRQTDIVYRSVLNFQGGFFAIREGERHRNLIDM